MKKLILCLLGVSLLGACAHVKEAKGFANCKYTLKSVELTDYSLTVFRFNALLTITNMSRKQAAVLKRFDGKLTVNDEAMANVTLQDIRIEPAATKNAKMKLVVPMARLSNKLIGLISMDSATLDYHLTGTMYFEGPMGTEIPVPVDVGRYGSHDRE